MLARNSLLKLICFSILMSYFATSVVNANEYKVVNILNNGDYVINGMVWRPTKACPNINKGDSVVFSQGNRNGHCVSATIVKNKEEKPCQLWCGVES